MSTVQPASKSSRWPYVAIAGALGCLILCMFLALTGGVLFFLNSRANAFVEPTPVIATPDSNVQTSATSVPQPTAAPDATQAAATDTPSAVAPSADVKTFTGTGAPFTIQYPGDWTVDDQQANSNLVVFVSPDQAASASISYGGRGTVAADTAMDQFIAQDLVDPTVIDKTTNPDGSIMVEVEDTNQNIGGRVHGYLRLLVTPNGYYFVQFNATTDTFAQYQDIGKKIVSSLTVGN